MVGVEFKNERQDFPILKQGIQYPVSTLMTSVSVTRHSSEMELDRTVLKYHVTKWIPQFKLEEREIKMDLKVFYTLLVSLILIFVFILRTVLFNRRCNPTVTIQLILF